jgi:hypothetical protein
MGGFRRFSGLEVYPFFMMADMKLFEWPPSPSPKMVVWGQNCRRSPFIWSLAGFQGLSQADKFSSAKGFRAPFRIDAVRQQSLQDRCGAFTSEAFQAV